jgi:hypothetical protein
MAHYDLALALALCHKGQNDAAVAELNQAIRLNPNLARYIAPASWLNDCKGAEHGNERMNSGGQLSTK